MGLTRAEQDDILKPVVLAYARVHHDLGYGWPGCSVMEHRIDAFRAALRLDDPVLDDIIRAAKESGQPLQWASEVPA